MRVFAAENIKQLLNHIGRCHRNDPNFYCVCGMNGCTKTFRKYYSWRKHLQTKHSVEQEVPSCAEVRVADNGDENDTNNEIEYSADHSKSTALYILKLQEDHSLPKSTVESVIVNTKSILQETLLVVETQL